ncbi:2OG-Fe(II) oxygenase [Phascolomyces articulosus]|uniref:2OG-Fe(II) oxygenase n=1 Tax=Phascolomyces articulosus TaxID=60185 RepID=A0AAD5P796_9FUNG|nr:2OG-Fe(II) oxygenase [Phascolomyces articulosus]
MTVTIPVLDLSKFRPNDPEGAASTQEFLDELYTAMHEVGFFYVRNHGVKSELLQAGFEASKNFFNLPLEEKLKIEKVHSPHFRGYTQLYQEITDYKQDNREQVDIGREFPAEPINDGRPLYRSMRGPNLWPEDLPEFKKTILELMQAMTDVGITILRAMARSLKVVDEKEFMAMFNDDYSARMKLTRYPGMKNTADKPLDHGLGVGPHKDYGFLALLLQDPIGGLQVQTHDGQWIDATPIPDTFVVNIGETLERLTSKTFIATTHRVLNNPEDRDRFSIPVFLAPSFDTHVPVAFKPTAEETDSKKVVSDIQENQLLQDEVYGVNELNGFFRSHPRIRDRWYIYNEETKLWSRRETPLLSV